MLRTEASEGITLRGNNVKDGPDALWRFDSRTEVGVDFIGHPEGFRRWPLQQETFLQKLTEHATNHDFVVVDLTGANEAQTYEILEHVYSLPSKLRGGITFTGW